MANVSPCLGKLGPFQLRLAQMLPFCYEKVSQPFRDAVRSTFPYQTPKSQIGRSEEDKFIISMADIFDTCRCEVEDQFTCGHVPSSVVYFTANSCLLEQLQRNSMTTFTRCRLSQRWGDSDAQRLLNVPACIEIEKTYSTRGDSCQLSQLFEPDGHSSSKGLLDELLLLEKEVLAIREGSQFLVDIIGGNGDAVRKDADLIKQAVTDSTCNPQKISLVQAKVKQFKQKVVKELPVEDGKCEHITIVCLSDVLAVMLNADAAVTACISHLFGFNGDNETVAKSTAKAALKEKREKDGGEDKLERKVCALLGIASPDMGRSDKSSQVEYTGSRTRLEPLMIMRVAMTLLKIPYDILEQFFIERAKLVDPRDLYVIKLLSSQNSRQVRKLLYEACKSVNRDVIPELVEFLEAKKDEFVNFPSNEYDTVLGELKKEAPFLQQSSSRAIHTMSFPFSLILSLSTQMEKLEEGPLKELVKLKLTFYEDWVKMLWYGANWDLLTAPLGVDESHLAEFRNHYTLHLENRGETRDVAGVKDIFRRLGTMLRKLLKDLEFIQCRIKENQNIIDSCKSLSIRDTMECTKAEGTNVQYIFSVLNQDAVQFNILTEQLSQPKLPAYEYVAGSVNLIGNESTITDFTQSVMPRRQSPTTNRYGLNNYQQIVVKLQEKIFKKEESTQRSSLLLRLSEELVWNDAIGVTGVRALQNADCETIPDKLVLPFFQDQPPNSTDVLKLLIVYDKILGCRNSRKNLNTMEVLTKLKLSQTTFATVVSNRGGLRKKIQDGNLPVMLRFPENKLVSLGSLRKSWVDKECDEFLEARLSFLLKWIRDSSKLGQLYKQVKELWKPAKKELKKEWKDFKLQSGLRHPSTQTVTLENYNKNLQTISKNFKVLAGVLQGLVADVDKLLDEHKSAQVTLGQTGNHWTYDSLAKEKDELEHVQQLLLYKTIRISAVVAKAHFCCTVVDPAVTEKETVSSVPVKGKEAMVATLLVNSSFGNRTTELCNILGLSNADITEVENIQAAWDKVQCAVKFWVGRTPKPSSSLLVGLLQRGNWINAAEELSDWARNLSIGGSDGTSTTYEA